MGCYSEERGICEVNQKMCCMYSEVQFPPGKDIGFGCCGLGCCRTSDDAPLKSLWLSERLPATVIAAPAAPTKQAKMRSDAFTLEHLYRLLGRLLFSGEQHHGSSQQLPSKSGELSDTLGDSDCVGSQHCSLGNHLFCAVSRQEA